MNGYVVLVSHNPEHRKSIHRHIVEAETIEDAADKGTEMCSNGLHVDTVVEVFEEPGNFFTFDLRPFDFPR